MTMKEVKAMCLAWNEMNNIRARSGVPYDDWAQRSDVTQEHWDEVMKRLDDAVKAQTGRGCHCHPAIYDDSL